MSFEYYWFNSHLSDFARIMRGHLGFITILHFLKFHNYISLERFYSDSAFDIDITDFESYLTEYYYKANVVILRTIREVLLDEISIRRRRDLLLFTVQRSGLHTDERRTKLILDYVNW